MKTILHKSEDRGHANHGWLDARHSFSFANFHDPSKVHFGVLRVLNDDHIASGMGFGMHPHDNMEIVTIPLSGALRHRDSMGNTEVIQAGDVQLMSAGKGIYHSEINANKDEDLRLLQIWLFPKKHDIEPRYDQMTFDVKDRQNRFQTVVSPLETADGGVKMNQDAWFSLGNFEPNQTTNYAIKKEGNGVYAFVIEGEVEINGQKLNRRDALGISEANELNIKVLANTELLLMDLPMVVN